MQPFDYNRYLKNNPLLKESIDDEEGSGYSYEYKEGPGASAQELARTIKQFQSDKFTWEKLAKNDFYAMAQGQAADIKSDYYPDWKKSDFEKVIKLVDREVPTRQMTGDADADWMGEGINESAKTAQTLKSTKPGDKLTLVLDDDSTVTVVRVGTDKRGEPTFKHIKNNKEVGTASGLSASHIKSVK